MFPVNTILAWIINIYHDYKEINNNFIIASRAYFLQMMRTMISPSGREVPPAESLRRRAKVLLPKFRLETAALRPGSSPLIFFSVKMTYILEEGHRWWAWVSTTHQGAPRLPGMPRWVVPTWWAPSGSYLLQYSSYIPKQFSVNFQLI